MNSHGRSESILHNPSDALWALSWCGRAILGALLIGWIAWFYPFDNLVDRSGSPLGGDYVMLYVAGRTVAEDDSANLYNDQANQLDSSALFPSMDPTECWPYRYPPVTAWLMSGLASMKFGLSFAVFAGISSLLMIGAVQILLRELELGGPERLLVFFSALGWPLVGEALLGGQTSPFALFFVVSALIALRRGHDVGAGILLGLCIYKPNIVGIVVIGVLVARPKTLLGMLVVAVAAAIVSVRTAGMEGLQRYAELATSLATTEWQLETPYWKVHGLAPYIDILIPGRGKLLAFGCGLPIAIGIGRAWQKATSEQWWLFAAALLIANSLFNPYVPIYDMLLLAPAGLILAITWTRHANDLPARLPLLIVAVCCFYAGPHISQSVSKVLGVQLFPLLLLASLLWLVHRYVRSKSREGTCQQLQARSASEWAYR